jgi:hypothetical protein
VPLALVVSGTVIVVLAWMLIQGAERTAGWGFDFRAYYDAAVRFVATGTPYQTETLSGPFQPGPSGLYLYTPLPALLVVPLTWLGLSGATLVWLFIRLGLLVAACALMPVQRWVRFATLGVAILSAQFLFDLNLGNVSLIVTFFAVVAWRWLDRPIGGVAVAASITIRPAMGVIWLWWIVRRRWQAVAWTVIGGAAIVLASLPFTGPDPWLQFVTVLRNVSDVMGTQNNVDLGSTALAMGFSPEASTLALFAGYALAVAATLISLRRDREISFAVTLMATLLLSPLMWNHYLTNLIVPAALLASRGRRWGLFVPLLGWLPPVLLPVVAIIGMLVPFLAPDRGVPALALRADEPESIPNVDARSSGTAGA